MTDEAKTLTNMDEKLDLLDKKLSALLAVTIIAGFTTAEERGATKLELVLHKAGVNNEDIARILDKKIGAVTKAIQRGKK